MSEATKPTSGCLLIAEPFLGDPNFERSVILLCEHNTKGSFGLVLNQLSNLTLKDAIDDCYVEIPLHVGGPVEHNTLHYIHRLGDLIPGSVNLGRNLYWSGDFETLKTLVNVGQVEEKDIRFFLGYSGWGEGQLDAEMNKNSWIVSDIDTDLIFDSKPEEFWRKILRGMGGSYKVMSNYPTDPRLN
ncbi:YqgE/AlgH family protein [uncultured Arcticibacterium sp.]|uniref:YqgE/AlgH family protein n=1 Tax=uncultured Arcticibacterium sp. TaxID=2173042 RepID=UPI0030F4F459